MDIKNAHAFFFVIVLSSFFDRGLGACSGSQFSCYNGNCIPQTQVNNSVNNCGDNSDEGQPFPCPDRPDTEEYKCTLGLSWDSGFCIDGDRKQDGIKDCPDWSDEALRLGYQCRDPTNPSRVFLTTCEEEVSVGDGAVCDPNSNVCTCRSGWYADTHFYRCIKRKLWDACVTAADCYDAVPDSACAEDTDKCVCNVGWYADLATNTTCIRRKLGGICSIDDECSGSVPHSNCTEEICVCNSGFYQVSDYECKRRLIGEQCTLQTDCTDAVDNSECSAETGRCACLYFYVANSARDTCSYRKVGDTCNFKDQCTKSVAQSDCIESTCTCDPGYQASADKTSCSRRRLGDACATQQDCTAAIVFAQCASGKCACVAGYAGSESLTTCTFRLLYDVCEASADCGVKNSYCGQQPLVPFKQCMCSKGYTGDMGEAFCTPNSLGSKCEEDAECTPVLPYSECRYGECACVLETLTGDDGCTTLKVGEACSSQGQCAFALGETAACVGGKCVCGTGLFATFDGSACRPREVGDRCDANVECDAYIAWSTCEGGYCVCEEGYAPTLSLTDCVIGNLTNVPTAAPAVEPPACTDLMCTAPWAIAVIVIVILVIVAAIILGFLVRKKMRESMQRKRKHAVPDLYGTPNARPPTSESFVRRPSNLAKVTPMTPPEDEFGLTTTWGEMFGNKTVSIAQTDHDPDLATELAAFRRERATAAALPGVTESPEGLVFRTHSSLGLRTTSSLASGGSAHQTSAVDNARKPPSGVSGGKPPTGRSRGKPPKETSAGGRLPREITNSSLSNSLTRTQDTMSTMLEIDYIDNISDCGSSCSSTADIPDLIPNGAPRVSTAFAPNRLRLPRNSIIDPQYMQ